MHWEPLCAPDGEQDPSENTQSWFKDFKWQMIYHIPHETTPMHNYTYSKISHWGWKLGEL